MDRAEVERQLANVTYSDAIKEYSKMKQNFIKEYAQAIGDSTQVLANQYINDFINEINNKNLQGQAFGLTTDLVERLEAALEAAVENKDLSQFETLEINETEKYGELTEKGKRELAANLETVFDLNALHRELEISLKSLKADGGVNTNDILMWSKSYVLSKFYNKIKGIDRTYGRRTVLAGYFEEALMHKATQKLTKHLKNKVGAFQTGSTRITNSMGHTVESVFDEYFNFMSDDLSREFQESINIDTNQLTSGFGAQVKLWNPPWNLSKSNVKRRSIASNVNLYAQWGDKTSWIKGVQFLHKKVREAMGDNVMYILGNAFYWTADLIRDFRANEYFLAFSHDGKSFTQKVAWEQIDMSKPFDN